MYINRKDALEILRKLSREPYYQHDGEDYYVGVAEATGEIYSMPSVEVKSIVSETLTEILGRAIYEIPNDVLYKNTDQYFRAGVDEGVNRVVKIILEYTNT